MIVRFTGVTMIVPNAGSAIAGSAIPDISESVLTCQLDLPKRILI